MGNSTSSTSSRVNSNNRQLLTTRSLSGMVVTVDQDETNAQGERTRSQTSQTENPPRQLCNLNQQSCSVEHANIGFMSVSEITPTVTNTVQNINTTHSTLLSTDVVTPTSIAQTDSSNLIAVAHNDASSSIVGDSITNNLHRRALHRGPSIGVVIGDASESPLDNLLSSAVQLRRTDTAATVRIDSNSDKKSNSGSNKEGDEIGVDNNKSSVKLESTPEQPKEEKSLSVLPLIYPDDTPPSNPVARAPDVCINLATDVNGRIDTQVEVKVYPCNANGNAITSNGKKKFTQFTVKPEGIVIQGNNRRNEHDIGTEYAKQIGRELPRYDLADTRASQLLVTSHGKNFWVVPAPEAFSRHSGTCRLLGDRKHPPTQHTLQVGDFLRVGSVGVVVIETNDGMGKIRSLSEDKIQKIMKDTAAGGCLDLEEEGGGDNSVVTKGDSSANSVSDQPVCYMCFDESNSDDNPLITPCQCLGDTRFVHVDCLRKWHSAEADNQICFLSSVDATCSVCKTTFKSDFKLPNGKVVKLFKSSLEPPYVSLLIATKHEMAQRLFNTRFQLSFSTLLKPDRRNASRPLLLGRSSGSDMVLDYRTVSARHASIRFKNGEFIFTDAGSSNGSYLYLRRPIELTSSQPVQFRLGRSMISMKVVNKWNRRFLRAVRRTYSNPTNDDIHYVASDEENPGVGLRRTRSGIFNSLPPIGQLAQNSNVHLDLLHALAYPKRAPPELKYSSKDLDLKKSSSSKNVSILDIKGESEVDELNKLLSNSALCTEEPIFAEVKTHTAIVGEANKEPTLEEP